MHSKRQHDASGSVLVIWDEIRSFWRERIVVIWRKASTPDKQKLMTKSVREMNPSMTRWHTTTAMDSTWNRSTKRSGTVKISIIPGQDWRIFQQNLINCQSTWMEATKPFGFDLLRSKISNGKWAWSTSTWCQVLKIKQGKGEGLTQIPYMAPRWSRALL